MDTSKFIKQVGDKKIVYITLDYWKFKKQLKTKSKDGRLIYDLEYKVYNQSDTVDILLSGKTISFSKKMISIGVMCGGTLGYIPDGRSVYNKSTRDWTFYSWQQLEEAVLANLKRKGQ